MFLYNNLRNTYPCVFMPRRGLEPQLLRCVTSRTVVRADWSGGVAAQTERPLLLVVDADRAVLARVGTGLTCLDAFRALLDTVQGR